MTLSREDVFGGREFLDELVEELETSFPHYEATPTDNIQMIMYRSGQRDVVNFIKSKLPEK